MAKFARDCLRRMNGKTKELEIELGPDTTELKLRVGLHSGPVVAGVLRGEKSRFQLFGDTMNTARYGLVLFSKTLLEEFEWK
jgi:class 3 adenylate cyclase